MSISITQEQTLAVLRSFLLSNLPSGMEVFEYDGNRVPEPVGVSFVVMTPMSRVRLRTNVDSNADALFAGSITGSVLTVSSITRGTIEIGAQVFAVGLIGTIVIISAFISGTSGGVGTYSVTVSPALGDPLATSFSSGQIRMEQGTHLTIQLDVHGSDSADNAQIISTLLRDSYAVDAFQALNSFVSPLHADNPIQVPFINAENQYEFRWVVSVQLQVDATVTVPQQYADAVDVPTLVEVDTTYPP